MLRLWLAALAGLSVFLLVRDAEANGCNLYQPAVVSPEVPINCPIVLFAHADLATADVTAIHYEGSEPVDVTASTSRQRSTLKVRSNHYEAGTCAEYTVETLEPFDVITIELEGVEVGDDIALQGVLGGTLRIVDAAACPSMPPVFYCNEPVCTPEGGWDDVDDEGGGCSTNGASSGGFLLVTLFGLFGLRRRLTPSRTARAR